MKIGNLKELTGKMVRNWNEWLRVEGEGCCSLCFDSTDKYIYCVCMGWRLVDIDDGPGVPVVVGNCTMPTNKSHQEWRIYWKIGRQTRNNIMQCDFDIDFEMPFDPETGYVDDTSEEVECTEVKPMTWSKPKGYRDWNALASYMRKQARRVFKEWKDEDETED